MERLDCLVKEYAWGKKGSKSEVARLFAAGHKNFEIGQQTPYAELWMGTHPDGPAKIRQSKECLSNLIARAGDHMNNNNKQLTYDEVHLPFIMKIMSIKHTLSLQVHPTKVTLNSFYGFFRSKPKNYTKKTQNIILIEIISLNWLLHLLALSFYAAFDRLNKLNVMGEQNCQQFENIAKLHTSVPNDHLEQKLKNALRECFATMLEKQVKEPEFVNEQLKSLYKRIDSNVRGCLIEDTIRVMRDTYQRFPHDVGCFAPLYVNHMILKPGECCFYAAEELHAYLSGECVECVGCSNNTIRAALTPKYIDRENLIDVLNYRMTEPDFYLLKPRKLLKYPYVLEFKPAECEDFTLHQIEIPIIDVLQKNFKYPIQVPSLKCPSIIVFVEGSAECEEIDTVEMKKKYVRMQRGDIYYIPPKHVLNFISISILEPTTSAPQNGHAKTNGISNDRRLLAYRTFSYEPGPDHSKRLLPKSVSTPAFNQTYIAEMKKKLSSQNSFIFSEKNQPVLFPVESEMDGFC